MKSVIKKGCIITDVGSVKGDIHRAVCELDMEDVFIGGHPMTGSEKTGYANATSYLLENAYYILTPTAKTAPDTLHAFQQYIASLGAQTLILGYEEHRLRDRVHQSSAARHCRHTRQSYLFDR